MIRKLQIIALTLGVFFAAPVVAQSSDIKRIISDQIDAFLQNDVDKAFEFASPTIKRMFGSPEKFGDMVRDGYPMVWRPADMAFGELKVIEGKTYQTVFLTDRAGKMFEAAYEMVETADGWQINGVFIREADLGV